MDATGKILISQDTGKQVAGFTTKTMDVSKLQNGIYLLEIELNISTQSASLIIDGVPPPK